MLAKVAAVKSPWIQAGEVKSALGSTVERTPAEKATATARLYRDVALAVGILRPSLVAKQVGAQIVLSLIGKDRHDDMPFA